jgi:hypothetical protein
VNGYLALKIVVVEFLNEFGCDFLVGGVLEFLHDLIGPLGEFSKSFFSGP